MHAYCQFVMGNGEKCTKNYKYDELIGNLSYSIMLLNIVLSHLQKLLYLKFKKNLFINMNKKKKKNLY